MTEITRAPVRLAPAVHDSYSYGGKPPVSGCLICSGFALARQALDNLADRGVLTQTRVRDAWQEVAGPYAGHHDQAHRGAS